MSTRNFIFGCIAAVIGQLSCSDETPATQIVVALNADATLAAQLTNVRVFTYDVDQLDESKPAGEHVFTVATGAQLQGQVTFPFSFGISKRSKDRLRLVVKGYASAAPAAPAVIEQKVITAFQSKERLGVSLFLPNACYGRAAECAGLEQTCVLATQAQARCVATPSVFGTPVAPGDELPNDGPVWADAGSLYDAASDASTDASPSTPVAPIATGSGNVKSVSTEITPNGVGRFEAVAFDSAGNIFAAGSTAPSALSGADKSFVVAKYRPDGALDTSFGVGGYAVKNVAVGGSSGERAVALLVQGDGKIVVAGDAEHDVKAAEPHNSDTDVVLMRFAPDGSLDTAFGSDGVVRHDVSAARYLDYNSMSYYVGRDMLSSMTPTHDGKLLLHLETLARDLSVPRTGTSDYALLRLNADGSLDTSFGNGGAVYTNVIRSFDTPGNALILADGSLVLLVHLVDDAGRR